jgi:hypothetical protein
MAFNILSISAKSDVPLYVYVPGVGRKSANTTTWQTLWAAPKNPTPYAFAAWNCLASPKVAPGLSVVCTFGSAYNGQTVVLEGLLNNASVVMGGVTVRGTGQHTLIVITSVAPIRALSLFHSEAIGNGSCGEIA